MGRGLRWVAARSLGPAAGRSPGSQPGREVPDDRCRPIHCPCCDPAPPSSMGLNAVREGGVKFGRCCLSSAMGQARRQGLKPQAVAARALCRECSSGDGSRRRVGRGGGQGVLGDWRLGKGAWHVTRAGVRPGAGGYRGEGRDGSQMDSGARCAGARRAGAGLAGHQAVREDQDVVRRCRAPGIRACLGP